MPHAGGGLPSYIPILLVDNVTAPRGWGSTASCPLWDRKAEDCPTPVGVYPAAVRLVPTLPGLPHAGGGLPRRDKDVARLCSIAPRRRGSTFASAFREVQLCRLPHAGGGLPPAHGTYYERKEITPRRRGSIHRGQQNQGSLRDCPTLVGVYRRSAGGCRPGVRLPHAGGGLPRPARSPPPGQAIAPRRWGLPGDHLGLTKQALIAPRRWGSTFCR